MRPWTRHRTLGASLTAKAGVVTVPAGGVPRKPSAKSLAHDKLSINGVLKSHHLGGPWVARSAKCVT